MPVNVIVVVVVVLEAEDLSTGFIVQTLTATGMYQKGQYSKSLYKIWLDIQVIPKMAVATNCKQFYQQSYSTYSKIQISQSKKSTCYVFKMSQHKHNLCHCTESKRAKLKKWNVQSHLTIFDKLKKKKKLWLFLTTKRQREWTVHSKTSTPCT